MLLYWCTGQVQNGFLKPKQKKGVRVSQVKSGKVYSMKEGRGEVQKMKEQKPQHPGFPRGPPPWY